MRANRYGSTYIELEALHQRQRGKSPKDFVDFLIHILTLPLSTIICHLGKQEAESSLASLYESIDNLNESYIQPNQTKAHIFKPVPTVSGGSSANLLGFKDEQVVEKWNYWCERCEEYFSDNPEVYCPDCDVLMTDSNLAYMAPHDDYGGFVKEVVAYMVMDDLAVMPLSTMSCLNVLKKFDVKEKSALEERVVSFGMDEAMKLLRASFRSRMILVDVFLKGKGNEVRKAQEGFVILEG